MTPLGILQHALGLDDYGHGIGLPGEGCADRNHYITAESSADFAMCRDHVAAGRMRDHGTSDVYGGPTSHCFTVTDAGRRWVRENSPTPPRLSRSKQRYQRWLESETTLTFGQWLKGGWAS